MKTALILVAALSSGPAQKIQIEVFTMRPGETITCNHPAGCTAMTNVEMVRFLDALGEQKCKGSI